MLSDFIALVCPGCGGKLEIQSDLQKCFCTYCGTELLLRHADGLLTAYLAKDNEASTTLQEAQSSMLVLDILKNRMVELETKGRELRANFLRTLDATYRKEGSDGSHSILARKPKSDFGKGVEWFLNQVRHFPGVNYIHADNDDIALRQQPGLETIEDLFMLYNYYRKYPKGQGAREIIYYLQSVADLHQKWVKTKTEMEEIQKKIIAYKPQ